ncbi:integral membrane protein TIGR01906 [Caldanaerobius fijiensis DSM 17918]|uniref:Integral membrane protein TIGR01906 n=1 Tax=Caldanaerobius fijiensis DSM 17918 TaxID=1121256 RepID=A0A1M5EEG1_9THEO|nr:TIGR01906 family membrane protein [Caldanaerobius fijiensis]SHF77540.1 integral membrane protein TIGR01906 [Caldanaerobius fijiensis DSM 17918]
MQKIFAFIMAVMFIVSMVVALLLTNLQVVAFNDAFYRMEFKKYNISRNVKISYDELVAISKDIQEYLLGKRGDLNIVVNIEGKDKLLFDRRELRHMEDVRDLFKKGFLVRNISTGLLIISIIYFWIKKRDFLYVLIKWLAILSAVITGIVFILFYVDFNRYFTYFHLIFFNNNLWLLDPSKEMLVNLFPQGFFSDAAFYIIAGYLLELIIVLFIARRFYKRI